MAHTSALELDSPEYVTALAPESEHATTCSSAFVSALEEQIEHSKSHWSQLAKPNSNPDEEEVAEDNVEVFKTLQRHPTWGDFFCTFGYDLGVFDSDGELVVGEKFAEGGQAELYHAQVTWWDPKYNEDNLKMGIEHVLKVFKKGTLLRHLQSQWPQGMLQFHAEEVVRTKLGKPGSIRYKCAVMYGTLLKEGRFAFLMERETEDLCILIERCMGSRTGQDCGPFSKKDAKLIMYHVARRMDWLHSRNIVHRDLKASNVLLKEYRRTMDHFVADFECSIGVVGTGFFRAPEILQACKDRMISKRPEVFSKEADVYSYGMTCYEILTGKLPFAGHPLNDYDLVLNGQCPELPEYVDD